MATPHINAEDGAFAETILLPGDPLRAKYIAETFMDDIKQVTDVRNMFGFTGSYQGKPVSVMGTGMGIPSCSIYATELITEYGVKHQVVIFTAQLVIDFVQGIFAVIHNNDFNRVQAGNLPAILDCLS